MSEREAIARIIAEEKKWHVVGNSEVFAADRIIAEHVAKAWDAGAAAMREACSRWVGWDAELRAAIGNLPLPRRPE